MKAKINSEFINNIKFTRYEEGGTTYYEPKDFDNGCLLIEKQDNDVPHKKLEAYSKEDTADLSDLGLVITGVDNLIINDLEVIKE